MICPLMSPQGSFWERLASFFIGGAPRLRMQDVVHSAGDRFRLQTVSGGVVHVQLGAPAAAE
jgi:B9 domain-containing protein 2